MGSREWVVRGERASSDLVIFKEKAKIQMFM